MKKYWTMTCLLLLVCLLVACGAKKEEKSSSGLKIVTSFYPIYSLVKEVVGDVHDVRMIRSGSGIHAFEPSANDIRAIYDADVFVYHSRILEGWAGRLDPNLEGSDVRVLEAGAALPVMKVSGLEDVDVKEGQDEATLYDPHTWLDPILVGEEATVIAEWLAEVDPEHAELYQKNATELVKQVRALTETYQGVFDACQQKTFVTQHTAFSYTARRFGLTQLGIAGVSEEEPSPRQLAEIKDFVETYRVGTIFTEKGVSDKLAQSLATSTGVTLRLLDPLEADPQNQQSFLENLEDVLATLAEVLQEE